jgi:hypothetical protein
MLAYASSLYRVKSDIASAETKTALSLSNGSLLEMRCSFNSYEKTNQFFLKLNCMPP